VISVPLIGAGRPRTRPDRVRADKAYSSRVNRTYLRRRAKGATIPEPVGQPLAPSAAHPPLGGAGERRARPGLWISR